LQTASRLQQVAQSSARSNELHSHRCTQHTGSHDLFSRICSAVPGVKDTHLAVRQTCLGVRSGRLPRHRCISGVRPQSCKLPYRSSRMDTASVDHGQYNSIHKQPMALAHTVDTLQDFVAELVETVRNIQEHTKRTSSHMCMAFKAFKAHVSFCAFRRNDIELSISLRRPQKAGTVA
jgi:hypothetical protein